MESEFDNEDHRWLRDALGGFGTGRAQRFLIRPSVDHPEFLLPLEPRAATVSALHRSHDGRTVRQRVETLAAQGLARLGLLSRAPGSDRVVPGFALLDELADRLHEPELTCAITLGPRRRNRKPVLQLIRGDGSTVGFAKIGWSPFTRELVGNEATILRAIAGRLPSGLIAPSVRYERETSDSLVIVTTAVPTPLRAHRAQPLPATLVTALASCLGTSTSRVDRLPYLRTLSRSSALVDVDRLLRTHGAATIRCGLWHGDLTRWNTATSGGTTAVWDWEFAATDRPVGFDHLHQRFEQIRRTKRGDAGHAIDAVIAERRTLLAGTDQPVDAVVDLYLAELIHREARLAGEGWDPADLGPLDRVAADRLAERLK